MDCERRPTRRGRVSNEDHRSTPNLSARLATTIVAKVAETLGNYERLPARRGRVSNEVHRSTSQSLGEIGDLSDGCDCFSIGP